MERDNVPCMEPQAHGTTPTQKNSWIPSISTYLVPSTII
jgi:hypothetical protein